MWDGEAGDLVATYPVSESNHQEWAHVAGVFTGKAWNLYIDGKLVDSTSDNADQMTCSDAYWAIGKSGNHEERYFHGYLDEVQFYLGALSDREVKALYLDR